MSWKSPGKDFEKRSQLTTVGSLMAGNTRLLVQEITPKSN